MATNFTANEMNELADQMHAAVEALDVAKVQALLGAGVDPGAFGISPRTTTARFSGRQGTQVMMP